MYRLFLCFSGYLLVVSYESFSPEIDHFALFPFIYAIIPLSKVDLLEFSHEDRELLKIHFY